MEPLKANYTVEEFNHKYTIINGDIKIPKLPSVTTIKNIINKGNGLMIWSRREALKLAEKEITEYWQKNGVINQPIIAECMAKADREPDRIKDEAGDLGDIVHTNINDYILGKMPDFTPESKIGFNNFLKWLDEEKIQLFMGDTRLASLKRKFGGRADGFGLQSNDLILMDWKTSKKIYDDQAVQVGGYLVAAEEQFSIKIPKAAIVRFDKIQISVFEHKWVDVENAKACFIAALELYYAYKPAKLWI